MSTSLITASTVRSQTMADGTLRLVVDVDQKDTLAAFQLFHAPGSPLVIGRLTQQAAQESVQKEAVKGGELAKLAARWCLDTGFLEWLDTAHPHEADEPHDEKSARAFMLLTCHIDSRAELDNNPEAAEAFHELIRKPYLRYQGVNV